MNHRGIRLALIGGALLTGCGSSFSMATPQRFVELDEEGSLYDARFTTADGVVLSVRELPHEPEGDMDFWVEAIQNRIRMNGGYALVDTRDVRAASGHSGKQLRFGRDQQGTPYRYWVTLFLTERHLFLVEAGGRTEVFDEAEDTIESAIEGLRLH